MDCRTGESSTWLPPLAPPPWTTEILAGTPGPTSPLERERVLGRQHATTPRPWPVRPIRRRPHASFRPRPLRPRPKDSTKGEGPLQERVPEGLPGHEAPQWVRPQEPVHQVRDLDVRLGEVVVELEEGVRPPGDVVLWHAG